jgi:prevent-host-death family protein
MEKKTMPRIVSALTARTQFGQIMRRAKDKSDRFVVGRRGEPQVVIMGVKDFIDTIAPEPEFLRLIGEEAKRKGKNKLTMRQIQAEIRATRRERRSKYASSKSRT